MRSARFLTDWHPMALDGNCLGAMHQVLDRLAFYGQGITASDLFPKARQ